MKKFTQILAKPLQDLADNRTLNILPALTMAAELYDSTIRPRFFSATAENPSPKGLAKWGHVGWSEHDDMCAAFKMAHRIESHISPDPFGWRVGVPKVHVEIQFYEESTKDAFYILHGSSNLKDGTVSIGAATIPGDFLTRRHLFL